MPYIQTKYRNVLDPHIEKLAAELNELQESGMQYYAGCFNYVVTRLLTLTVKRRYMDMALAMGNLASIAQEFYRRVVAPYENKKCKENGDVY